MIDHLPIVPMAALSEGQRLVVWTARCWVYEHRFRCPVFERVRQAYDALGVSQVVSDVNTLFSILATRSLRPLAFGEPGCQYDTCRQIGDGEAMVVNCLASRQRRRVDWAQGILDFWVADGAAAPAMVDRARCSQPAVGHHPTRPGQRPRARARIRDGIEPIVDDRALNGHAPGVPKPRPGLRHE